MSPQASGGSVWKAASATGRGRTRSPLVTMSGHRKLPHWVRKVSTAQVASAGRAFGSATSRKVRRGPAPSTRAASSRLRGRSRKKL